MSTSEDSYESECDDEMPRNIEREAESIASNLLPEKSRARYTECYREFMAWRAENNTNALTEDVFLVYFNELSSKIKPSTMWSRWSMLKSVMNINHGINIDNYQRLKTLMKNKSKGFLSKKARVFSWCEITRFIDEATDNIYLAMKVILIFGVCGALRSIEFCNLTITDVEDTGSQYIVSIRDTKNYYPRSFVIGATYYKKVKQYTAVRPNDTDTNRFFLNYQHGKCTRQVIGKNKISETPKTIALFLGLPNPENYTGHSFRRTSATLLANSGANLLTVKQHGGWKSNTVAEGYIENSLENKKRIFDQIVNSEKPSSLTEDSNSEQPPTSTKNSHLDPPAATLTENSSSDPSAATSTNDSNAESQAATSTDKSPTRQPASSTETTEHDLASAENYVKTNAAKPLPLTMNSPSKIPLTAIENLHSDEPSPKRLKKIVIPKKASATKKTRIVWKQ